MHKDLQSRIGALSDVKKRLLLERLTQISGKMPNPSGGRLVAAIAANSDRSVDAEELRRLCEAKLPAYMVPQQIVQLEKLPTTAAGKIDRAALELRDWSIDATERTAIVGPRNAVEEKLVDIWRSVLGFEDIGVHDNFFELGGDSLLIIRILSRAAKQGLSITPDVFFAHPTIAQQARVAAEAPSIRAETGVVTGRLPLLPIQQWFFDAITVHRHHWNLSYLFEVLTALSPEQVERAIQKILLQHDALRSRFTVEDGQWSAELVEVGSELPLLVVDISGVEESKHRKLISQKAAELNGQFDLGTPPLIRFAYFATQSSGPDYLLIVAHHLVVDAESWEILTSDLDTVMQQLAAGQSLSLPAKTTSMKTWSTRLEEHANSPDFDDQSRLWRDYETAEIPAIPIDARDPVESNVQGDAVDFGAALDRAATDRLLGNVTQSSRTSLNAILISAFGRTVAAWTNHRDIVFDIEGHGREALFDDVDISRTVGWFTTVFPVVLRADSVTVWQDPLAALRLVKEQISAQPKHALFFGLARYMRHDRETQSAVSKATGAQMLFNYLGQQSRTDDRDRCLRLVDDRCGPARSERCERPYFIEINSKIVDGQLEILWTYNEAIHSQATIQSLSDRFISALHELIDAADRAEEAAMSPADFPLAGLSQQQLDRVSEQLGSLDDD